jgi:hypothetical protein
MKSLLLIVLVAQYSIIYAQSLVGLIDRDNFTTSASIFNLQNISSTNPSTYTINTSTINNLMSGETIYFIRLKSPYKMELLKWINN